MEVSDIQIYFSDDYDQFDTIIGNRAVSQKKVGKLVRDIKNGLDLTKHSPIIVDGNLRIIDGQHRFEACKKLGKPIYFVYIDNLELRDIARINSASDKWKTSDFINCYCDLGIEDYKVLRSMLKTGYSVSVIGKLLMYNTLNDSGSHLSEIVQDGRFQCKYKNATNSFLEWYFPIKPFAEKPLHRPLMAAFHKVYENPEFDIDELIKKLKKSGDKIEVQASVKKYLSHIEDLYNFRNKTRKRIF